MQRLTVVVAALSAMLAVGARTASADTFVLTDGFINEYYFDTGSAVLIGPGLQIFAKTSGVGAQFYGPGTGVDFSGRYGLLGAWGNATINGATFHGSSDQVWIGGAFDVSAVPFSAPPITAEPTGFFRTPFTLTGRIFGSTPPGPDAQILFSVDVAGSGTAFARYNLVGTEPPSFRTEGLSFIFSAPSPAPTTEPATLTLLGCGLVGFVIRRRRKPRTEIEPS
jgi:hypothetical protein